MKATAKLIGMGLICAAVMGFAWGDFWNGVTQAEAREATELQTLLDLGQDMIDQPQRVVIKWQGEWDASGQKNTKAAARNLSQSLELPPVAELMEDGHKTYRVLDEKNNVNIRFNWQEINPDQSYIIIQLEAEAAKGWDDLTDLQQEFGEKMRNAGIDAKWNASLQGTGNKEGNAADTMNRIEGSLARSLDAVPMETYEDETTVSNAYQVPSLSSRVRSGNTWLNMQVAVHEDETSGENRVTIGLPVITIEY
ncbi:YwmB family TATA-box binding protein [Paenibacillus sp. SAF-054]|uniref:YwmB family TATA-box binding protein n=1 Tax=unclassified Paenibacillus TaxID=185978 RepID=UPI003F80E254